MKNVNKIIIGLLLATGIGVSAESGRIYIDNVQGNDSNDGGENAPLKTIAKGIRQLQNGMTLLLTPSAKPYEPLILKNLQGTKDKPIVIDGQGAIISGESKLDPKVWEQVKPSLFRKKVPKHFQHKRYFIIIDDQPQRMGIYFKLRRPPLKKVEELKGGEWTFDATGPYLYVKVPLGMKLANISEPISYPNSGVALQGECRHIVIRNMTVEYVFNDGFNIHGKCKDILFENIVARNCGDDGISAHGSCEISVRNFISRGNPSGICHVSNAIASHENAMIKNSAGINLLLLNKQNNFTNLIVDSPGPVDFGKGKIVIKNALFKHPGNNKPLMRFRSSIDKIMFQNVLAESYNIQGKPEALSLLTAHDKQKFDCAFVRETMQILSIISRNVKNF